MPPFRSQPLNATHFARVIRKHPAVFGVPFLLLIVGASFGLQAFTQTRYDFHAQKVQQVSQQDALGLSKDRKKFDIREAYFRLQASQDDEWEPKRIQRPAGLPDWGVPPSGPPADTQK